jgi:hypothetical protein
MVTKFLSGAADKGTYFSHAKDLLFDVNLIRTSDGVSFLALPPR